MNSKDERSPFSRPYKKYSYVKKKIIANLMNLILGVTIVEEVVIVTP